VTEAVIVSTARTGLAKSWKGAFNMTYGATLGAHSVRYAVERAGVDPAEDARAAGELVNLVHISDSWRNRFAHTQVGRGEIDFPAFADTVRHSS